MLSSVGLLHEVAGVGRMAAALSSARRADRWRSWQARALLDGLGAWRCLVAIALLSSGTDPTAAVAGWEAEQSQQIEAARALLHSLDSPGIDPLPVVALALRRLPVATGSFMSSRPEHLLPRRSPPADQAFPLHTRSPPIHVSSTGTAANRSGSTASGSAPSTTKSARYPGASLPFVASSPDA